MIGPCTMAFCPNKAIVLYKDKQYCRSCRNEALKHDLITKFGVCQDFDRDKITVEFCNWLQDTDVFDMFVSVLSKGITIEEKREVLRNFDINNYKPKTKAKGA